MINYLGRPDRLDSRQIRQLDISHKNTENNIENIFKFGRSWLEAWFLAKYNSNKRKIDQVIKNGGYVYIWLWFISTVMNWWNIKWWNNCIFVKFMPEFNGRVKLSEGEARGLHV